jgi:HSP20 family protein
LDGQVNELAGQRLAVLAIGQGGLQGGSLGGGNALADVFALLPDLVFEIRTGSATAGSRAVFGLEGSIFHGVELGHLLEDLIALSLERFHGRKYVYTIDILQSKKARFYEQSQIPVTHPDIEVSLHEGMLTLSGERKSEETTADVDTHRTERFFGRFQRSLTLPKAVKTDKVAAQYRDGVLTVTLPKSEEVKPKQIEVNVK